VKRQPHSATTLKKWRGEESPSVLRRRGCQLVPYLVNVHGQYSSYRRQQWPKKSQE